MARRLMWAVCAVVMLLLSGTRAEAAQWGTLWVSLDYGDDPVTQGEVMLYRVGEPVEGGYRLAEACGGGVVRQEDAQSAELAQWLSETAGAAGEARLLDADGDGVFYSLTEGLYLLVQTEAPEGYACAQPFLIPMPCQGQWTVQANPKTQRLETESPKTGDALTPLPGFLGMALSGLGLYFCARKRRRG